jgi:hypothetical protein
MGINLLFVLNVVHVCRFDHYYLITQPCHVSPLFSDEEDGLLVGRDPLLPLIEHDERQEVDLLFRELERILSPAPDRSESVSSFR